MFTCTHCDGQFPKWQGRCTECGKWGTLTEESESQNPLHKSTKGGAKPAPTLSLSDASISHVKHIPTQIEEFDRVLCGGIVPGSVTLLAGEPGIGKSTIVAQLAHLFSTQKPAYYVSGEESEGQVAMRLKRLNVDPKNILFSNAIDIDAILSSAKQHNPSLLIIDSIQTMIASEIDNLPGTPTAVRAATAQLIGFAKQSNTPVLLIGQMTKDGSVAGPKTLEHLVDTVLTLEGDKQSAFRLLHCGKNRFGSTDEVGIFEMTQSGLQGVDNPSARFLEDRTQNPGSVVTCVMEGTRPILVEVQALAEKSLFANPIRRTSGYDASRLQMLLAIISKRAGVAVSALDVYVNVVGGIKIKEPAADLAICAAIISSVKDTSYPKDTIAFGEMGLSGEIRTVPFIEKRIKEAQRLGFTNILSPKTKKHLREIIG
ncbi:MAG: repair protein radA protein [Candidatus Uhrbacteria bacterium GW2011_GWD2_41_121]|uniref:DNA repair protein RadA n=1 Tax=Candidatus Uhrbacteria bacterium GW2011_GWC1_41_20 TaxID=1618983 RepID=A0A0G0XRT6_9BACT|nr:MAG: repair protein radA protein [Candidatus Uhrbacteria bacterium GW2011_GWE1_39_46]KKR64216.1 MAG: repair protein radA protein [Candidatus Uhrbacteria bacterium GW2011_GWC2_40_450]KKR90349.1 MAG: repair protein radA protein [Candidatus Uhrbacteria bacterium GW2011_GWD2_41_121]KKR96252.1 MAG: repair protein radA protein [Candidatus Uhrbacteria bacterium GW2011_GWD1_41_16]KKR99625.1 MAG: repair protein radA protein [Candidatus Uhrbacteria bacterium GW2011_GWC1_41_20]KKS06210.1 MAG: repair p